METEEEAFGYFFRKRCSAIFLVCCLVIAETVHVAGVTSERSFCQAGGSSGTLTLPKKRSPIIAHI